MRLEQVEEIADGDLEVLLDVWVAAWAVAMPEIDFEGRRVWFATRLAEHRLAGSRVIVGRDPDDARPIAFAVVNPALGYLDQVAVDPGHQSRGLARVLIEEAKRLCPQGLDLHVNTDNGRAVRLYERCGFSVTGEGHNARSGLPILTMAWRP